jgi:hypothetical protein
MLEQDEAAGFNGFGAQRTGRIRRLRRPDHGGRLMELAGKYLVAWLCPEAIETFLGLLEPSQDTALTAWTVAGLIVGEAGPGLWVRVKRVLMPDGQAMPLHEEPVYFLRWELVTTARLYDAMPADVRRIG